MKAFGVIVSAYLIGVAGCVKSSEPRGEVIRSASGQVATALVTKDGSGGATTSFVYRVYLKEEMRTVEVLRAIRVERLDVEWKSGIWLTITMPCGDILAFQNFHDVTDIDGKMIARVRIVLDSGGPCG